MPLRSKLSLAFAAVAALSAGAWLSSMQQANNEQKAAELKAKEVSAARKNFSPIQGSVVSPARKIMIPALSKDNGEVFTLADLTGQWHFLFFGYTHCPDVCPVTMGVLAQAKKMAAVVNRVAARIRIGFVFIVLEWNNQKIRFD